jgi:hypothetical protein
MAVVGSAKEVWERRSARYNGGEWTYTRGWLVETDSKTDREGTVSGATGLPAYGAAHPDPIGSNAYATDISYTQKSSTPFAWDVVVTYSSKRTLDSSNPASDEVLVSWSSEIYDEAIFADTSGNAILNSAGDYFIDPTPTRDAAHLIAKIRSNQTSVPSWVLSYQNSINNGAITIGGLAIAAGLAKFQRLEIGEREDRNGTAFYPVSFEIHIHKDGWALKPLDAGFREISRGNLIQILNPEDGEEVTTPALLDGSGAQLLNPSPATAVFGNFTIYPQLDFTTLPGIT